MGIETVLPLRCCFCQVCRWWDGHADAAANATNAVNANAANGWIQTSRRVGLPDCTAKDTGRVSTTHECCQLCVGNCAGKVKHLNCNHHGRGMPVGGLYLRSELRVLAELRVREQA